MGNDMRRLGTFRKDLVEAVLKFGTGLFHVNFNAGEDHAFGSVAVPVFLVHLNVHRMTVVRVGLYFHPAASDPQTLPFDVTCARKLIDLDGQERGSACSCSC